MMLICFYWSKDLSISSTTCCASAFCTLASLCPCLPGTSGRLTALWFESSSTCYTLFVPSCPCVWHITSSPPSLTHSWSASWRASSATFLISQQTPWWLRAVEAVGNSHCPTCLTDDERINYGFLLRSYCFALTGHTHTLTSSSTSG